MILTTLARGPSDPVTGQMDFIAMPCQSGQQEMEPQLKELDQAFSRLAKQVLPCTCTFGREGSGGAVDFFQSLSVRSTLWKLLSLEWRIWKVYTQSKWNRKLKIPYIGLMRATFLGMIFGMGNRRVCKSNLSHKHIYCLLNKVASLVWRICDVNRDLGPFHPSA